MSSSKMRCTPESICFSIKQIIFIISTLLIIIAAAFGAGYFLGTATIVYHVGHSTTEKSLADHVYASVYRLAELDPLENETEEASSIQYTDESEQQPGLDECTETTAEENVEIKEEDVPQTPPVTTFFYAPLIGFSTCQAAQQFFEKMYAKGIVLEMRERGRHRKKKWYQIITPLCNSPEEVQLIIDKVQRTERLARNIQIIPHKK
jgi:hypothetical protein